MMKIVLLSVLVYIASAEYATYVANIVELSSSGVTGTVVVFAGGDGTTVGYAGFAAGVETGLVAASAACNKTNGCGVHIHNGTSCATAALQGGHYFTPLNVKDPWINERYSSNAMGKANFGGIVEIGTDDLEGRPFLIHDKNGDRDGCGILNRVPESDLLQSFTTELSGSGVSSVVTAYNPSGTDTICLLGKGQGLEPRLLSYLSGGTDCTKTNGCGAHVHAGSDCTSSATQMGHYYDNSTMLPDPWNNTGYRKTSEDGTGWFTACAATGKTAFTNKAFVVHSNEGSRVSCGLLQDCVSANKCTLLGAFPGRFVHRDVFGNCVNFCWSDLFSWFATLLGYSCGGCP